MSITLGIVGAGAIGAVHTNAAKAAGSKVLCIADVNEKAAKKLASETGVANTTGDPQEPSGGQLVPSPRYSPASARHPSAVVSIQNALFGLFGSWMQQAPIGSPGQTKSPHVTPGSHAAPAARRPHPAPPLASIVCGRAASTPPMRRRTCRRW